MTLTMAVNSPLLSLEMFVFECLLTKYLLPYRCPTESHTFELSELKLKQLKYKKT